MNGKLRTTSGSPYEVTFGFARAVREGNRIIVAGTGPVEPDGSTTPGGAAEQAARCCAIIVAAIEELGGSPADVVRTRMLLTEDDEPVQAFITGLRERGVSLEALFMDLLAPAAGHLGLLWERDLCAFGDVTIALGRLQILLRELGTLGEHPACPKVPRRLLLLGGPGEQHTFGLQMVGELFHREGWDVDMGLEPGETVAERVRRSHVDVVGLTAGTRRGLDGLAQIIATVRRHSRNPHVSIIIGGPALQLHPDRGNRLDADAIITNGASAPALAERLVAAQKRPR